MSLVEMRDITKVYPNGVVANKNVNFTVKPGEIHALVGENGAGKSTLMKVLYGLEQPTEGQILLRGQQVEIKSSHQAIDLGIGMVHQNFMLIPSFTVAQNIVLGQEPTDRIFIDRSKAERITNELSKEYGLAVEANAVIDSIPVGMRQRVEILKTLYRGADLLILDEPTAVLTPQETQDLFNAVRRLVEEGKTVIFITHKLREVKEISDRVTVMRHGQVTGRIDTADASEEGIARMMVGRDVFLVIDKVPAQPGKPVLKVNNLGYVAPNGRAMLKDVSFSVRAGEILGIAGVEGNGQTELVEVLTGLRPPASGDATVNGKPVLRHGPRQVREAGVAHIPEDRLTNGVALPASIEENLIVDRYYRPPLTKGITLRPKQISELASQLIQQFDIRPPDPKATLGALSGGNMQKVVVARELSSSPALLIAAQPTRGVDVGATEFVREQLVEKRTEGCAVLLVSADLTEVMSLSDRIAAMYDGEIVGIFPDASQVTEKELGLYMLGLERQSAEEMEAML